jgi:biotin synthase-like enzyme
MSAAQAVRHDWTRDEILALFNLPFNDLLFLLDQNRRLPGRLRLLPAKRPL